MTLLGTDTRKLYTDCLTAPAGYRFDRGVATTFTLSLETLLILPFTLATQGVEDPELLMSDPAALLDSLQETTHRLAVFCHEGYTSVPAKGQLLYGQLDRCVVPVRPPPPGQFFHPKLWLLRFVGEDPDDVVLRAVVLSRNLTFDRSWDTVLCLDGTPSGRRVKDSFGLETLVGSLPGLATSPVSGEHRSLCEMLAEEAARTKFAAPEPFREGPVFHAIGVRDKKGQRQQFAPAPEGNTKRLLCVSPFLSAQTLETARASVRETPILITRDASAVLIEDTVLEPWDVRVLADAVETGESADDASDETVTHQLAPSGGLHAKVYVYENTQGRATWFLGSANLTKFGWPGLNVELMVELSGGAKQCGIDAFLEGGFSELLEGWTRSEPDPELEAQEALRGQAEAFRDAVAQAQLSLRCVAPQESEAWALELLGNPPRAPEGITCSAWPVTAELAVYEKRLGATPVRWEMNSPAELTGLIAFNVLRGGPAAGGGDGGGGISDAVQPADGDGRGAARGGAVLAGDAAVCGGGVSAGGAGRALSPGVGATRVEGRGAGREGAGGGGADGGCGGDQDVAGAGEHAAGARWVGARGEDAAADELCAALREGGGRSGHGDRSGGGGAGGVQLAVSAVRAGVDVGGARGAGLSSVVPRDRALEPAGQPGGPRATRGPGASVRETRGAAERGGAVRGAGGAGAVGGRGGCVGGDVWDGGGWAWGWGE